MRAISKKRMDELIPLAIKVIHDMGADFLTDKIKQKRKNESGEEIEVEVRAIPKTVHGYFSAYGADMVNTTPLAATIFYEQADSGAEKDRTLVPKSILALLKEDPVTQSGASHFENLQSYIYKEQINGNPHPHSKNQRTMNISAAAAALKIALRTFPKS